ncbi:MAG TPA: PIN domain-containing protein [Trueperaceae bacterium]|nr:PIN domain-containing protein [Trueperaceae bacterium]
MLIDVNLLIYATHEFMPEHKLAKAWLEEVLNSQNRVAIPWSNLLAFIRISSNPRIFDRPLSTKEAVEQVKTWYSLENVWVPQPGKNYFEILTELLLQSNASGNLVSDAHLAALSIEHGLTLYSTDSDFAKFKVLKWVNPLDN